MSHARSEYEDFKALAPDAYDLVLALGQVAAKAGLDKQLLELVKLSPFWSNEEAPEFTPAIPVRALRQAGCLRDTVGGRVTHGLHGPPAWQYVTISHGMLQRT